MQDLRLALRGLRATPIVSAVAILSLALGIGANTAISDITPASGSGRNVPIGVPGVLLPEVERLAFVNVVSPDWFTTYGAALRAGRDFTPQDRRWRPSSPLPAAWPRS